MKTKFGTHLMLLSLASLTACTTSQDDGGSDDAAADTGDASGGDEETGADETGAAETAADETDAGETGGDEQPLDPDTAPEVVVDRFGEAHGTLFVRSDGNGLPAAGEPIDFDEAPFITRGLGPAGESVRYYNFDVQPTAPAPIYVLFAEGSETPVEGQLNIVDVVPGDAGYNDFWNVVKVSVPADYVANTVTSLAELQAEGYTLEVTDTLVNCPVVPDGSTADLRGAGEDSGLTRGWYKDQVVHYFNFSEAPLATTADGAVPTSPIYVTFNVNPGEEGGGPPSGFVTEDGSDQTHNVVATLPGNGGYSPLWLVNIYDNADFASVTDLATAAAADLLAPGAAIVNCPVVDVQ